MKIYHAVCILVFGIFLGVQSAVESKAATLQFLTTFPVEKPAFITSFPNGDDFDLVISSFGFSIFKSYDKVRFIPKIGDSLQRANVILHEVKEGVLWPNEISLLNDGKDVVVPGGFLVPTKNPGHISTMKIEDFRGNPETAKWTKLVQDDNNAYFHQAEMIKVYGKKSNSSGIRMVSCRGRKPILPWKKAGGEMIYLEPKTKGGFEAKLLFPGCDTFWKTVDLNQDGIPEFIIPQFYTLKLVLMWTDEPNGDYTKQDFIRTRVIDADIGKAFDSQLTDLDLDGQDEILVTNHQNSVEEPRPELISYKMTYPSIPAGSSVSKFMEGIKFEKVVISNDYILVDQNKNAGAPGTAIAVRARNDSDDYPVIIVSGDGSFKAYLLNRGSNGQYSPTIFHDCKGTVGSIHVKDVDGDGWNEVFVPCYNTDNVVVYTFKPQPEGISSSS